MNDLKIFSKYYIQDQEKLNKIQKNELLTYVESASDIEIKALLLSGYKQQVTKEEGLFINELFESYINYIYKSISICSLNEGKSSQVIQKLSQLFNKNKLLVASNVPSTVSIMGNKKVAIAVHADYNAIFKTIYNKAQMAIKHGVAIGTVVLVAMIALIARKAYTAYLSKTAKFCKDKTGDEKKICFQKYYINALKNEISQLEGGKSSCDASKEPDKCRFLLDVKIKKKQNKINSLSKK